jgi:8-oxo-dGTP pyrophosphatase MutT (NUDIX family)
VFEESLSPRREAELARLLAERRRGLVGDLDPRLVSVPEAGLVRAAVLVLLERGGTGYCIVFTKRTQDVETHKGEVSFAGGMRDPQDSDDRATALREASEEIGVEPQDVTVLGELDPLVTVTGFHVTPVVGVVDAGYVYRNNPAEVERVLRVPMAHLREPSTWFEDLRTWRGEVHRLRSCRFGDDIIWGATSRMLQGFLAAVPPDLLP